MTELWKKGEMEKMSRFLQMTRCGCVVGCREREREGELEGQRQKRRPGEWRRRRRGHTAKEKNMKKRGKEKNI